MLKRFALILLAGVLAIAFVACGKAKDNNSSDTDGQSSVVSNNSVVSSSEIDEADTMDSSELDSLASEFGNASVTLSPKPVIPSVENTSSDATSSSPTSSTESTTDTTTSETVSSDVVVPMGPF